MPERNSSSHSVTGEYQAKTFHEAAGLARSPVRFGPKPFGDPFSGVMLVAEVTVEAVSAQLVDALHRSLAAVKLDQAYVTWPSPDLLEEILSVEPGALVAVGPDAAQAIDSLEYPLARMRFLESPEGSWFVWKEGTFGLLLPALAPALDDAGTKRRFWQAFLALRDLVPAEETGMQEPERRS